MKPIIYPDFILALRAAGFADAYYGLCERFPYRDIPPCRSPRREVEAVLRDVADVRWSGGRDGIYVVRSPRIDGVIDLSFWFFSSRDSAEICLNVLNPERNGTNAVSLAWEVKRAEGKPMPNPPFPRPCFKTLYELRDIVAAMLELAAAVGEAYQTGGYRGAVSRQ